MAINIIQHHPSKVVLCLFQVFVWEDEDEEEVSTYKAYEGHTEDVLAMAAYPPKQLLATGTAARMCCSFAR